MMKIATLASAILMICITVFAEMPTTTVTPENAASQDVQFYVNIEPPQQGTLSRITLTMQDKTGKYGKLGQPGLYLKSGSRPLGHVALYKIETDKPAPLTYWCDLANDYLESSIISVPCYPDKPDDNEELCSQSMEYTINLKDYKP